VKGAAVLSERGRSYLLAARGICWMKPILFAAVSPWLSLAVS
jgi:hypothetical protein